MSPVDRHALCVVKAARGAATGFVFLEPRFVVTARHVVTDHPEGEAVRILFEGEEELAARAAFLHPQVDLAVLELLDRGPCRFPLQPAGTGPWPGSLLCVGYKPSLSHPKDGRYTSFVSRVAGFEETRRQRDGYEERLFMFPAPDGEPGHSGGPLLTASGRVLGVIINGIDIGGRYFLRATSIAPLAAEMHLH
jgi:hypothetical protein